MKSKYNNTEFRLISASLPVHYSYMNFGALTKPVKLNKKKGDKSMNRNEIIRAWKDPMFRASLDSHQLSALPANPAGMMELTDADLEAVNGAGTPIVIIIVIIATLTLCTVTVH